MKGFSERIYNEASRLITLVEDIIKISKLDEKSFELEKQEVDLYLLVREICTRLAPQAEKKSVRFEVSGEHVSYNGIRQILDEMIYNLCENAVKYNVKGGKSVCGQEIHWKAQKSLWKTLELVFQRKKKNVFLSGFIGWIRVTPGKTEELDLDFLS